jgi:hypothetical protein
MLWSGEVSLRTTRYSHVPMNTFEGSAKQEPSSPERGSPFKRVTTNWLPRMIGSTDSGSLYASIMAVLRRRSLSPLMKKRRKSPRGAAIVIARCTLSTTGASWTLAQFTDARLAMHMIKSACWST